MLDEIYNYFKDKPTNFEFFATYIIMQADKHVVDITNTRPTRDGGRDGIGEYRIMNVLGNSIKTIFAVETKCYSINDSVGVKETSRLISRIRNRQFGVLVTTSFVAQQAYEEIIEDQHPIAIIAGKDIVDILFKNEINDYSREQLQVLADYAIAHKILNLDKSDALKKKISLDVVRTIQNEASIKED